MKKLNFSISALLKAIVIIITIIATVYPFIHMFAVSTSANIYVLKDQVGIIPKGFNLKVYGLVFEDRRIFRSYINTVIYTSSGTLFALTITCMGAYALSKKRMLFNKFFSIMILFTMFFNGGLIPTYLTVRGLGMYDTIWAIIIPGAVSTWYLLIMRTFFVQFPVELEESGKLDGLSDIGTFLYIVIPLSKAVLATIGLFYAVGIWNSYFGPMIYLSSESKAPLQIILRDLLLLGTQYNNQAAGGDVKSIVVDESLKYATVIVSIVPIIMVYPFLQKYFVKGVMIGSLKG